MSIEKPYSEISSELDRMIYAASHALVENLGRLAVRFSVEGAHHLPREGGALIVCNHLDSTDVLFVPSAVPFRHVTVAGRRGQMEKPVVGALFRRWGAVTIDRAKEGLGREAILQSLETIKMPLQNRRLELLFASPDTRTPGKKPAPPMGGVVRAAQETQTDVYAAVIKGSDKLRDRRVTVAFSPSLGRPDTTSPRERNEFKHYIWKTQTELFDNIPHHSDYYLKTDFEN